MADILPFPLARRVDLIERQAHRFLYLGRRRSCKSTLAAQLHIQREALLQERLDPASVEREVAALATAIRAAAWRLTFGVGVEDKTGKAVRLLAGASWRWRTSCSTARRGAP